jgi:hypothetical protein
MARIDLETGPEGPKHDPYHYDEWTVTLTSGSIVRIHDGGWVEWVETERPVVREVSIGGSNTRMAARSGKRGTPESRYFSASVGSCSITRSIGQQSSRAR